MTRRALRPCAGSPLCPELVEGGGYCAEHRRLRDLARGTAADRGYDKTWRTTRADYLAHHAPRKNYLGVSVPICENCGRCAEETQHPLEVDHIDGLGPDGPRGHDPTNLQALCRPCHQTKTAHQTGTAGGPR